MLKAVGKDWETERLLGYEVDSTLEHADSFTLEIGVGQSGENAGRILPGGPIQLLDSRGKEILTGIIDEVNEDDVISVKGRDLMAHAIDRYPDPKRWKSKLPLEILKELAADLPFASVDVSGVTTAQTPMKTCQLEPGDSVADVFEKLGEEGDFEIYCDPLGNLVAANMPDSASSAAFRFVSKVGDANCEPKLKMAVDDCFSTIKSFGRKAAGKSATNDTIAKYITRTLTQKDGDARTAAEAGKRIDRKFREMLDSMRRWTITFGGDHAKFGATPKLGDGVSITSYRHKVEDEPGIVWGVNLKLDKGRGRQTEVEVRSRAL